jgi:hypothetical protein
MPGPTESERTTGTEQIRTANRSEQSVNEFDQVLGNIPENLNQSRAQPPDVVENSVDTVYRWQAGFQLR